MIHLLFLLCFTPAGTDGTLFEEITQTARLDFFHFNGMTGEFILPEIMGAGVALLDYDNDGDLDLYLIQGAEYPGGGTKPPLYPLKDKKPKDRLFRNDLVNGKISLVDVTEKAGINVAGFGMGATAGDFDNDGDSDLYVTNLGENALLVNNGDGTFTDRTVAAGVSEKGLSTSTAFVDIDRDGHLDLYVCNYVHFVASESPKCYANNSALDYCGPDAYKAAPDRLFHNRGNGTFEDWSHLLQVKPGAGLGVALLDADGDGHVDIYVANDGDPNHLWRFSEGKLAGNGEDEAMLLGIALNGEGVPEAGMGVTAADFDDDGDEDIFLTHLDGETNTLYLNDGSGFFDDHTNAAGLGMPSIPFTGFGTGWFDLDNDGRLDLLAMNGAVRTMLEQAQNKDPYPLKQNNQLYHQTTKGKFEEIAARGGEAFTALEVSRGAAFGDLDNDGDADLLLTNNHGPARLLLNRAADGASWLGLRIRVGKRDAEGALVQLITEDNRTLTRRVNRGGSYLSSHDPRVLFGLGKARSWKKIKIRWPDGHTRELTSGQINQYLTIERK